MTAIAPNIGGAAATSTTSYMSSDVYFCVSAEDYKYVQIKHCTRKQFASDEIKAQPFFTRMLS